MDFVPCPACGAMNSGAAETCAACKAPLDAEPEPAAPLLFQEDVEPPAPPEAPAPPPGPPPFDGPDAAKAKIGQLEGEIAAKPEARALYLQLAAVYSQHGRADLAAATVERALAREPQNAYLRHKLAQITGTPEARNEEMAALASPGFSPAAVGVAQRPSAPVFANRQRRKQQLRIAGLAAAVLVLALGVKLWFFPDTRLLVGGEFTAHQAVWSPSGRHVAFLMTEAAGSFLAVYDIKKGEHRKVGPTEGWGGEAFSWSPDGASLAYVRTTPDDYGSAIHVYDVATGQDRRLASGSAPSWRAGGTLLAVCRPEMRVDAIPDPSLDESATWTPQFADQDWTPRYCRIDAASGATTPLALAAEPGMSVSPLVDQVVYERWTDDGAAPADAGTPAMTADQAVQDMADMATAGNSRNLAEGSRNLSRELESRQYDAKRQAARHVERIPAGVELLVADVDRDSPRSVAPAGEAAFARWTPAGDRLLMAVGGPGGIEFVTAKPDGTDRQVVLKGVKGVDPSSLTLTRDGKWLFFVAPVGGAAAPGGEAPADLHVLKVGDGAPKRLSNRHSYKQRYAVSPDGRRVVYEVPQDEKILSGAGRTELWITSR